MFARKWLSVTLGAALAAALVTGCVRSAVGGSGGDHDIIDSEQIESLHAASAYDVVARTHAEFLHSRGRESADPRTPSIPAHVYIDDTYYSDDVSILRTIPASQVDEIRFYQAYEAQYKFGSGHLGGVVQIITKSGQ